MSGTLIAIEGIDGAGKTTLARDLLRTLRGDGVRAECTREPYTERWRDLVCEADVDASTADRAAHVHSFIMPELNAGHTVITDRYYLSCAAYAAPTSSRKFDILRTQRELFPAPDLWVWLDTPLVTCRGRVEARGETFPAMAQDIRKAYASLWDKLPGQKIRVTMDDALPVVHAAVMAIIRGKR